MTRSTTGMVHGRRLAAAALAVAALAFVAGCSAGRITQTDTTVAAIPGTDLEVEAPGGRILVRNAHVVYPGTEGYPRGGTAPLEVRIFNNTQEPVRLVAVTSPRGQVVLARGASASPSARATAGTPAPTASPTRQAPAGSSINVEIPAFGFVTLAPDADQHLQIVGLTEALSPGQSVTLTLRFSNGVTISDVQVPVTTPTSPAPRSPLPIEHGDEGPEGGHTGD